MDNIEEKLQNLEEWNKERERVKPFIDLAVDYHNRARTEFNWKNYEQAAYFYREAIKNYKSAVSKNPKYYLQDLLERIDRVIEEHINNTFHLKASDERLTNEATIAEFTDFVKNLTLEEKRYIDPYDITLAFFKIADYYNSKEDYRKARVFYENVLGMNSDRPFINRDAHYKIGLILFKQEKFKEALVSFVNALSYNRSDQEVIKGVDDCLRKLYILEHKSKFLNATPMEATKLIMEVL